MVVLISSFLFASCDKAKEAMDSTTEAVGDVANKAGEVAGDAVNKAGDIAEDAANKVGDAAKDVTNKAGDVAGDALNKVTDIFGKDGMVGTWMGKLDGRATTLVITKQDGNNFEGKITINYRTPINQEVKGSFSKETKTITMEDQIRSRVKGKYSGKISDDEKTYSGTFTTIVDKKSVKFSLVKK